MSASTLNSSIDEKALTEQIYSEFEKINKNSPQNYTAETVDKLLGFANQSLDSALYLLAVSDIEDVLNRGFLESDSEYSVSFTTSTMNASGVMKMIWEDNQPSPIQEVSVKDSDYFSATVNLSLDESIKNESIEMKSKIGKNVVLKNLSNFVQWGSEDKSFGIDEPVENIGTKNILEPVKLEVKRHPSPVLSKKMNQNVVVTSPRVNNSVKK